MNIEKNMKQNLEWTYTPPDSPSTRSLAINLIGATVVVLAGAFVGVVTSLLSNLIYIVILFPLGMGFIGAVVLERTITILKIRKLLIGIALGVVMAVVIYGVYHFTNYQMFRIILSFAMDEKLVQETGEFSPEVGFVFVDYALQEETGYTGALGYLLYKAEMGVSIGKIFNTNELNLGPFVTWLYWLVELCIIAWMTVRAAKNASGRPFCQNCNSWYGREEHVGGCSLSDYNKTLQILNHKDFSQLGKMLVKDAELPSIEIYLQTCSTCSAHNPWFILKRVSFDNKGKIQFKNVFEHYILASDKRTLLETMEHENGSSTLISSAPSRPINLSL